MKINLIGHLVKVGKTNPNKPKVKIGKMNVTSLRTMNYEQRTMNDEKNKPKQTQFQTCPIPRFYPSRMLSAVDDGFCDVVECVAGLAVCFVGKDGKYIIALFGAAYARKGPDAGHPAGFSEDFALILLLFEIFNNCAVLPPYRERGLIKFPMSAFVNV